HDLLRLRERAVDHAALAAAHLDANAVGVGRERVARAEHSPCLQAVPEPGHAVVGALALDRAAGPAQTRLLDDQHQIRHDDSFLVSCLMPSARSASRCARTDPWARRSLVGCARGRPAHRPPDPPSAMPLRLASPFSNSPPTVVSKFMKRPMAFAMKLFCPSIAHVTLVLVPAGTSVKVATFDALKGFSNSSAMPTLLGVDSMIFIEPSPIWLFPAQ